MATTDFTTGTLIEADWLNDVDAVVYENPFIVGTALDNYANDTAAAAGGIPLHGFYRNGSVVMQRVT